MLMSFTITISSCLSPGSGNTCCCGSSRIPCVSSAYISATRFGVPFSPARSGSSPIPSMIRRTPCAIRSRSTGGCESCCLLFPTDLRQRDARCLLNHLQRNICTDRQLPALLKLRHLVYYPAIQVRYFNIDWPILRFHLDHGAPQRTPLDFITADPERRRFQKQQLRHRFLLFWPTKHRQQHAGTVLLHLHGREV